MDISSIFLAALILIAASLYSSVGHGGASGYIAVMALMLISPAVMKPTALALNVLVAVLATFKFYRAGAFSWRIFLPLVLASIPFAYIGGTLTLPAHIYKPVVGVCLIYAAWRTFHVAENCTDYEVRPASISVLVGTGAILGFLSGLTGVGGGIFLSPILLFLRWAETKVISGIAAAFILFNSIAALAGLASKSIVFADGLPLWGAAALIGGFIGAEYGSKRLGNPTIQKLLSMVLVVAGLKMVWAA